MSVGRVAAPPEPSTATARPAVAVRVRVCIVAPSLDIVGGQSVQAQRLIEHLRGVPGMAVGFVAHNPRLPGPLRALQRVKLVRTLVTEIAYVALLLRTLRRYDVIHAFSASYYSYLLGPVPAMLVGRLYGKRVILNYHSGEAEDHLANWRTAKLFARLAHEIVVPSGYLVEVFRRHGLASRAVGNFVDFTGIVHRERPRPRPIFLANRNHEPLYNVPCALRAFARIQGARPDARLIVAGDGSQRSRLEALARELGLRDVAFVGRVAPAEMAALYDEADVYLNASDIDNMPLSILDAFAAALPVATTRAGGIPFLVRDGETGLLVECGDDEALAAAALRLLDEPGLALRLTRAAHAECTSRYAWTAVRDQWASLYRAHGAALAGEEIR